MRTRFLLLAWLLLHPAAAAFAENPYVQFTTTFGAFTVELCSEISARCAGVAPLTVANFLEYVDEDLFPSTTFIDKRSSVANLSYFQGGVIYYDSMIENIGFIDAVHIVAREIDPRLSNLRGSLGMIYELALTGSSSWWFVNLTNNAVFDTANGGSAVFGQVARGMAVVDAIGAVPIYPAYLYGDLPLIGYPGEPASVFPHLVYVTSTERVPEPGATGLAVVALLVLATRVRHIYPGAR